MTAQQLQKEVNKNVADVREEPHSLDQVREALNNEEALGKYVYRIDKFYWTLRT